MKEAFVFEVGKCYEHNTGKRIHIVAEAELDIYFSPCLIAETDSGSIIPVGKSEENAVNYHEITREEWLNTFKSSFVSEVEAEYGNGWIKDRVPSKEECGDFRRNWFQTTVDANGLHTIPMQYEYTIVRGKEVSRWLAYGRISPWEVLAWKPLDEPYKPGKGE